MLKKYRDEILQLPLCLSTHIIKGKLKILETNPESEEIDYFLIHIFVQLQAFKAVS